MLADVQAHFGFKRPLYGVGVFETDHQRTVVREVCSAVQTGRLVLLSGLVGSGKTHLLARIEDELTRAGRVAVSRSLAVEKTRVTLSTLIEALFYDLGDKNVVIPKPPEKRERELRDLVRKARRPVVLIVDEAQDLHPRTLTGLKRLTEVVAGGGGLLSMLLAAHPKLRIDLRRPDIEQVGYRTSVFEYDGVAGHQRDYMAWLLAACAEDGVKVADTIDADALDLLAQKLRTPLQAAEQRSQRDRNAPRTGL
jgi:type II secretory pathway predicted ATPase ExeA